VCLSNLSYCPLNVLLLYIRKKERKSNENTVLDSHLYIVEYYFFGGEFQNKKYSFSLSFGKFQNYPVHFAAGTFLVVNEQKEKDKKKY
jgi:hypothetical protein